MRGRRWDGVVDIYTVMKSHYKKGRERRWRQLFSSADWGVFQCSRDRASGKEDEETTQDTKVVTDSAMFLRTWK